jgi:hypothetical protein
MNIFDFQLFTDTEGHHIFKDKLQKHLVQLLQFGYRICRKVINEQIRV